MFRPRSIVIGGVLLAVLVGAAATVFFLRRGREKDWYGYPPAVACFKNVRQIGLACIQYAGDHGDKFPTSFGILLKEGYLTTPLVFVCPSRRREVPPGFPQDCREADLAVLKGVDEWGAYELAPGVSRDMDPEFIIVYEKAPAHQARERVFRDARSSFANLPGHTRIRPCMFNDGHMEYLREDDFQERIKAQEARIREMRQKKVE